MIARRAFLEGLGAILLARAGTAHPEDRRRRVGVLMSTAESDPNEKAAVASFVQGLNRLGWEVPRDFELVYRWGTGDPDRMDANAREIPCRAEELTGQD